MRLLLDTHTFIWWDSDPHRMSPSALRACNDRSNDLIVSVASVWEMQIKSQLGKLQLGFPLPRIIEGQRRANLLEILPVQLEHVLALDELPPLHRDPFDRLLIAQARVEEAVLVSADPVFAGYMVEVLW